MNKVSAPTLAHVVLDVLQEVWALHQVRPHLPPRAPQQLVSYFDAASLRIGRVEPLRVQRPAPDSLEASGTVRIWDRWLACAIHLDQRDNWECSDLRVVRLLAQGPASKGAV